MTTSFEQLYTDALQRVAIPRLAIAFLLVLAGFVLRRVLLHVLDKYISRVTARSRTDVDDLIIEAVKKPSGWALVLVGIYLAVETFGPSEAIGEWVDLFFSLLISVLITWLLLRFVNVLTGTLRRWAEHTESPLDDQLVPLVSKASKAAVTILAVLLALQNMGYSVSGLIAGLGVGGLAVALAAQKTLSDLFGSIMLLIDRPFLIGDWVKSPDGSVEGVVERIGFRSTKIRTFEKTLVYVPNSRLADFIIDNMARRPIRRVWVTVGVTYDTTAEQMQQAMKRIREVLESHPGVDQEFMLVRFTDFGTSSLDIMVYYFASTIDWDAYLAIREDVNLKIMGVLEDLDLAIALPTRTIHLAGTDPVAAIDGGPGQGPEGQSV